MKILALDLGKFNSVCCFYDSKTRKPKFVITPTKREHIDSIFEDAKADLVVMEACGPSGWINDLAEAHGHEILVCSTKEEAWRWANVKRKTDRDDARAAREAPESRASKTTEQNPVKRKTTGSAKPTASKRRATNSPATRSRRSTSQQNETRQTKTSKPRRARKPVSRD